MAAGIPDRWQNYPGSIIASSDGRITALAASMNALGSALIDAAHAFIGDISRFVESFHQPEEFDNPQPIKERPPLRKNGREPENLRGEQRNGFRKAHRNRARAPPEHPGQARKT